MTNNSPVVNEIAVPKSRNDSIDFVKLLAVFFVLNSHMGICYAHHSFLATGGAVGDALFFFISGFTLFLGGNYRFDNWYKRRLSRIYPSILAAGVIAALVFSSDDSFVEVITAKRYWFVQCIFLYYVVLYPIKIYVKKLKAFFLVSFALVTASYFLFFDFSGKGLFWGSSEYFRWLFFFLIVLQGAILGKKGHIDFKKWHLPACLICVAAWYAACFFWGKSQWQIVSVIPMFGITYFLYAISNNRLVKKNVTNEISKNACFASRFPMSRKLPHSKIHNNRKIEQHFPSQHSLSDAFGSCFCVCGSCFRRGYKAVF